MNLMEKRLNDCRFLLNKSLDAYIQMGLFNYSHIEIFIINFYERISLSKPRALLKPIEPFKRVSLEHQFK
jgi:hypothetical protein